MAVTDTMRFPGPWGGGRASLRLRGARRKTSALPPTCGASYISAFDVGSLLCEDVELETRDSPHVSAGHRAVRLRQQLCDALHGPRDSRRGVRPVPPLLHRQAEAGGYGGAGGALPPEVP